MVWCDTCDASLSRLFQTTSEDPSNFVDISYASDPICPRGYKDRTVSSADGGEVLGCTRCNPPIKDCPVGQYLMESDCPEDPCDLTAAVPRRRSPQFSHVGAIANMSSTCYQCMPCPIGMFGREHNTATSCKACTHAHMRTRTKGMLVFSLMLVHAGLCSWDICSQSWHGQMSAVFRCWSPAVLTPLFFCRRCRHRCRHRHHHHLCHWHLHCGHQCYCCCWCRCWC